MGEVSIACVPSTVYYFLSHVIRRYHERYPKVHDADANQVQGAVACVPSTVYFLLARDRRYHERYPKGARRRSRQVLGAIASGEVDFCLNLIGGEKADIEFRPLLEDRFVAACRRDHPLAKKAAPPGASWRSTTPSPSARALR